MDPFGSPRLGRRARYDCLPIPPHFPVSSYNSNHHHPSLVPLSPQPAAIASPDIPWKHYHESRFFHRPGDQSYLPSSVRLNPTELDPRHVPFPRVSDPIIHCGHPDDNSIPPKLWERVRGGGSPYDKPSVFDKGSGWFQPNDNLFKLGEADSAIVNRRRLVSEQVHFPNERESYFNDPFFERVLPEAAPHSSSFHSSIGSRTVGSVKKRGGEASSVFVRPSSSQPVSLGRSFSDLSIVKSTAAMAASPQLSQSISKKKKNVRDGPIGLGGRQCIGKAIKNFDPISVAVEDGFRKSFPMTRNPSSISIMNNDHEFEGGCYTVFNGKRKKSAKYNECYGKRPIKKPSALSRIHSGLSVWERLEEKPLINLSSSSPPCSSSSPCKISNKIEAKADNLGLSFKSNNLIVDSSNAEVSSVAKDLSVKNPNRIMKRKNMTPLREKVIIPVVSSSLGSSEKKCNSAMKKKNTKQIREKVVIPIVSNSSGSIAKHKLRMNSNASRLRSVPVLPAKKEVASCSKSLPPACTKKAKKMAVKQKSGVKEATKMSSKMDGGINETSMVKDGMKTLKLEDDAKEANNCTHNGDSGTEPIDDSHLQKSRKVQNSQATSANNVDTSIITVDFNRTLDTTIEIVDDCDEETLEIQKKLDNRCCSSLDSDANVCLQHLETIVDNAVTPNDSLINMGENDAENLRKPSMLELESFVNSSREIGLENSRCNGVEIEIESEVKNQEKMVLVTTSEELKVQGEYSSSQPCIQSFPTPSFTEVINAARKHKLLIEDTLIVDSSGERMGQDMILGHMKVDSTAASLETVSNFHPTPSKSMNIDSNVVSDNGNHEHQSKVEAFVISINESGETIKNHQEVPVKALLLPSHELTKQAPPTIKVIEEELSCKKASPFGYSATFLSNSLKFSGSFKEAARVGHAGRHRTWLRTNSLPAISDENPKVGEISSKQAPNKLSKMQNSSYFRKGNSLIRKLAVAESPPMLLPTVAASSKKINSITDCSVREIRSDCTNNATPHSLFERPKTPPLPLSKLSNFSVNSRKDFLELIPVDRIPEPDVDHGSHLCSQSKGLPPGNLEDQNALSGKIVQTSNAKKVIYVKHKLNQLVAAQGPKISDSLKLKAEKFQSPVHHSIESLKLAPFLSSDLYYRSKRNQLVRNATSFDGKLPGVPASSSNSVDSLQEGNIRPLKKKIDNVLQKAKMPSPSLVWTLGGDKLSQKCIAKFGFSRVFPHIIPWKRAINWKNFMSTNSIPMSSRSSLSSISRKLQCLRNRDTIYRLSTNGFSLRKARVVSIGRCSLKWSKSIEKRSKKANEEATLAVAEVERKKREKKRSKFTNAKGKNKAGLTLRSTSGIELKRGERIFRVGSARYKMDSSKRTLVRIPDDHSSSPARQQTGNNKLSFVPRRLVIGNDEYVRIGNGNQLIRDPKKLKRILANEKVRWSLHTARLRLAQKRQYCMFFMRFGKCDRRGGKCPYVHDPTKVAICMKFLKDRCSDANCKLTHKIIPERMPDCSYFLKGLCANISCHYRHVKVNANAPLCDGFLRGHCADGDECRKKHSYLCPLFEVAGKCPQGSLCKLHHPKNQTKSKKRKRTKIESGSHGRYFYASIGESDEPLRATSSHDALEGSNDIFFSDGQFTEYISLNVDGDDSGEKNVHSDSYGRKFNPDDLGMDSYEADALVKPVLIMNRGDLKIS